jgi:predicted permease
MLLWVFGFNPRHAAAVSFDLGLQGYSQAQARKFRRELLQRVALPGIESASVADYLPLSLAPATTRIAAYGQPVPKPNARVETVEYHAGANFFHTMQTRILEGRDFSERDTPGSQNVVVINQALASRLFPQRDALGKKIRRRSDGPWFTIIGITENGEYRSLNDERQPAVFWPLSQTYSLNTTLVARSPLPANVLIPTLRKAVQQMDSTVPVYAAGTLEQHLQLPLTPARVAASVLGSFGFLAVVLAAAGIYGSMAYSVARRTREIGIRVALGATRQNVLNLVLSRAAIVLAVGICVGLAAALATGNLFRAVLYGISPTDRQRTSSSWRL